MVKAHLVIRMIQLKIGQDLLLQVSLGVPFKAGLVLIKGQTALFEEV